MRVAVLDDYHGFAANLPELKALAPRAEIDAIGEHIADEAALTQRLAGAGTIVMMRERTAIRRALMERVPSLKLIVTAGGRNQSLDIDAAAELGIQVCGTDMRRHATAELTWALILALMRQIPAEDRAIREGRWQTRLGGELRGRTIGIIGLGNQGAVVAQVARAFGMDILAWSPNLTAEKAAAHGARLATKDELFANSDVVTIHVVLGDRSRGLVGARELGLMKPTAYLVNTSRAPIVDEAALLAALRARRIAGAGLDVYTREPIAPDNPFLALDNTVLTPHLGYTVVENYQLVYRQAAEAITAFLDGKAPLRPLNTPSRARA